MHNKLSKPRSIEEKVNVTCRIDVNGRGKYIVIMVLSYEDGCFQERKITESFNTKTSAELFAKAALLDFYSYADRVENPHA